MPLDIERSYKTRDVVAKLRRLADALEAGKGFAIQIGGRRVHMPPGATVAFEYECSDEEEEIEIEMTWKRRRRSKGGGAEGETE
ncbi:MAG: amphi-Trp domain-containing protein [Bacillota bacterium]